MSGHAQAAELVAELIAMTAAGIALTVVVAGVIGGGYLLACRIWPFTGCPRCDALGRIHSPGGKSWRECRKCKGTGRRLRIGRRLWNHHERTRRNA